jgi:hypothetical protein
VFLQGEGAIALPLFEITPELVNALCLGSVSNGLKFCTLSRSQCSFTTHAKNVEILVGSLYSSGHNSTFVHHFIDKELLTPNQLEAVLHTKED